LESLYHRAERVLNDAEASGDGRLALAANRELRETLGGLFTLASKAVGGGVCDVSDAELEAEAKRRGLDTLIRVKMFHIGAQGAVCYQCGKTIMPDDPKHSCGRSTSG
jgi:hypothetical protein